MCTLVAALVTVMQVICGHLCELRRSLGQIRPRRLDCGNPGSLRKGHDGVAQQPEDPLPSFNFTGLRDKHFLTSFASCLASTKGFVTRGSTWHTFIILFVPLGWLTAFAFASRIGRMSETTLGASPIRESYPPERLSRTHCTCGPRPIGAYLTRRRRDQSRPDPCKTPRAGSFRPCQAVCKSAVSAQSLNALVLKSVLVCVRDPSCPFPFCIFVRERNKQSSNTAHPSSERHIHTPILTSNFASSHLPQLSDSPPSSCLPDIAEQHIVNPLPRRRHASYQDAAAEGSTGI